MREVTEKEFFDYVGNKDIVTTALGNESIFKTRNQTIIGKIVNNGFGSFTFFLKEVA